jgi:hypothetical protein
MGDLSNRQNAQMAAMIKRNRKMQRKMQRNVDASQGFNIEAVVLSSYIARENRNLSKNFRALMIYNAFKKNRKFASSEGQLLSLGENALQSLKSDLDEYSVFVQRQKNQQSALNIVKHKLLRSDEVEKFTNWLTE